MKIKQVFIYVFIFLTGFIFYKFIYNNNLIEGQCKTLNSCQIKIDKKNKELEEQNASITKLTDDMNETTKNIKENNEDVEELNTIFKGVVRHIIRSPSLDNKKLLQKMDLNDPKEFRRSSGNYNSDESVIR